MTSNVKEMCDLKMTYRLKRVPEQGGAVCTGCFFKGGRPAGCPEVGCVGVIFKLVSTKEKVRG